MPGTGRGGRGEGHDAGRGAGDQREVALDLGRAGEVAEDAERAGVGVDQAGGDAGRGRQAEVARRPAAVSGPRSVPTGVARSGRPVRARRSARPDRREEVVLPAGRLVREVAPLAGQRALRAGRVAGGAPGQEVGEVEGQAERGPSSRAGGASATSASGSASPATWRRRRRSRTRWPVAVQASASAVARWSSQRMVSQRSSPLGRDGDGRGRRRRGGRASRWRRRRGRRPASGRAAASARAARSAAAAACQIWAEDCSAWPSPERWISSGALGAAEQAAGGVEDAGAGAGGADVDGGDERHLGADADARARIRHALQ